MCAAGSRASSDEPSGYSLIHQLCQALARQPGPREEAPPQRRIDSSHQPELVRMGDTLQRGAHPGDEPEPRAGYSRVWEAQEVA